MSTRAPVLPRLRALCLSFPGTTERPSWGHPNFCVGKRTFVAFERVKGKPSIAFRLGRVEAARWQRREQFFATPYGRGLWISRWVDDSLEWKVVADLARRSYRLAAPVGFPTGFVE
jgi:predicted DNA-binding protein (MmcQ/YjbR family)